jgi:hypothetical protein
MKYGGEGMSAAPTQSRKFTVAEYHRMIEAGILTHADNLELLEGYLIEKDMVRTPQHSAVLGDRHRQPENSRVLEPLE